MMPRMIQRAAAMLAVTGFTVLIAACGPGEEEGGQGAQGNRAAAPDTVATVEHTVSADEAHSRLGAFIEPVLRVSSAAVIGGLHPGE